MHYIRSARGCAFGAMLGAAEGSRWEGQREASGPTRPGVHGPPPPADSLARLGAGPTRAPGPGSVIRLARFELCSLAERSAETRGPSAANSSEAPRGTSDCRVLRRGRWPSIYSCSGGAWKAVPSCSRCSSCGFDGVSELLLKFLPMRIEVGCGISSEEVYQPLCVTVPIIVLHHRSASAHGASIAQRRQGWGPAERTGPSDRVPTGTVRFGKVGPDVQGAGPNPYRRRPDLRGPGYVPDPVGIGWGRGRPDRQIRPIVVCETL